MSRRRSTLPLLALGFSWIMGLPSCNSRPTYDITVLEFQSNCPGAPLVRVEHDPDPDVQSIKIEPEFQAAADQSKTTFVDEGMQVKVEFNDDSICFFPLASDPSICCTKSSKTPLNCQAHLKLIAYRWPSKGPGFGQPQGKQGEDTPAP